MNLRHTYGVLHSFSIKNIFYDKMDLTLFYFRVMKSKSKSFSKKLHLRCFTEF